jgi:hypothetical protein
MIVLVPVGNTDKAILEALMHPLEEGFGQKTQIGDGIELPQESCNRHRRQYLASSLLVKLPSLPRLGDRVVGVVDVAIFAPGLNFVFGEADISERRVLISLQRLRQEFYGLPRDENLFRERALKEAVHELGHTYGLKHCFNLTCIDGIVPAQVAASAFPQLKVIPGVEISTDISQGEVHILGYFIDYTDPEFKATLDRFRDSRLQRGQKMVAKLEALGIHIDWQQVKEIAGGSSIGRRHIAQAILEKGYVSSIREPFTEYLGRDRPAYVEREKMTPAEAVALIVKAGGLPVLAHPLTINDAEAMTIELKRAGLAGIEAYYDGYTTEETDRPVRLAQRHRLIVTGGSDYHELEPTETAIGGVALPTEAVERLIARAKKQNPKLKF